MSKPSFKFILGALVVFIVLATLLAFYGKNRDTTSVSQNLQDSKPVPSNTQEVITKETEQPPSQNVPQPAQTNCSGTEIKASDDIVAKISAGSVGETFCIKAGTYSIGAQNIVPKDRMQFIGEPVSRGKFGEIVAGTKIIGTDVRGVFYFKNPSSGVLIENLDISGATGAKDETDPLTKQYGRGVNGNVGNAINLTIRNSNIHNNTNAGVGGAGENLTIEKSELHHNGSESYVGCCSGGVKSSGAFTITDSYVHDNTGHGIWEDVCGTNFIVMDNRVSKNTQNGIRYEHGSECPGFAKIWRNTVTENNLEQNPTGGGIEINSAPGADVGFNILGNNYRAGIRVRGSRGPLTGTLIHDNVLNGDVILGCEAPGVTCN